MELSPQLTDAALLKVIGRRLAALRLARNLTQGQLAEQAGLGVRTVQRLELGAAATQLSGFIRICRVLELVEGFERLLPAPAASPMEQLRRQTRKRRRASGRKAGPAKPTTWTWGEGA